MAKWWVSEGLNSLLSEINTKWPNRSKISDGSIGDTAHSARASDHNPRANGEVCARDFTANGIDANWLAEYLRNRSLNGDNRIKYVIWNRRIFDKSVSREWRKYTGTNAHTHHVHVSVQPGVKSGSWGISNYQQTIIIPAVSKISARAPKILPTIGQGYAGGWVFLIQKTLAFKTEDYDGKYGNQTFNAVKAHQLAAKIPPTGNVDHLTWVSLMSRWGSSLKLGDKNPAVEIMQNILGISPDGDFGEQCQAAVMGVQIWAGLKPVDGECGPQTRSALAGLIKPLTISA